MSLSIVRSQIEELCLRKVQEGEERLRHICWKIRSSLMHGGVRGAHGAHEADSSISETSGEMAQKHPNEKINQESWCSLELWARTRTEVLELRQGHLARGFNRLVGRGLLLERTCLCLMPPCRELKHHT